VKVSVKDVKLMLDAAKPVGGLSVSVVADTDDESADVNDPLMDRIVRGVYVVLAVSPDTVDVVPVTPVRTAVPL
jgi:hypothetical protein